MDFTIGRTPGSPQTVFEEITPVHVQSALCARFGFICSLSAGCQPAFTPFVDGIPSAHIGLSADEMAGHSGAPNFFHAIGRSEWSRPVESIGDSVALQRVARSGPSPGQLSRRSMLPPIILKYVRPRSAFRD
jgi:hypothetical protein